MDLLIALLVILGSVYIVGIYSILRLHKIKRQNARKSSGLRNTPTPPTKTDLCDPRAWPGYHMLLIDPWQEQPHFPHAALLFHEMKDFQCNLANSPLRNPMLEKGRIH